MICVAGYSVAATTEVTSSSSGSFFSRIGNAARNAFNYIPFVDHSKGKQSENNDDQHNAESGGRFLDFTDDSDDTDGMYGTGTE